MAVATPPSASQELRADSTSASAKGRPIQIDTDYTVVGDVTTLHAMTQADVLDKVSLTFWNISDAAIDVTLIVSPNDDTVVADVDAASLVISVPPKRRLVDASAWVKASSAFCWYSAGMPIPVSLTEMCRPISLRSAKL